MIEAFASNDGQLLTLTDAQFGLAATVTRVEKGFAVTFIDTDSENIIEKRIYEDKLRAIAYARGLIPMQAAHDMAFTEDIKQALKQALKQAEHTLWHTHRYGKEFGLAGMEQEAKKSLAAVRKALRSLKAIQWIAA